MERIAFKMKLHAGQEAEYKRRHAAIWPDLAVLLKGAGIEHYSIFLDEETLLLFAYMQVADLAELDKLPAQAVMKKWWDFMKDIMDVHADNRPVVKHLTEIFYLP